MIIWRGWGILALVIPVTLAMLTESMCDELLDGGASSAYLQAGFGAGLLAVWFLGRWLNDRPQRILLDPKSGERVVLIGEHSLYWIPMQYWALIGLGGLVMYWLSLIWGR
ncbi:MAG: hypothetical protein LBI68_06460 [Azoarcus sp.]|jgi:hypothetical protein|nr:hypothetical protein [Azoarcus sp.]